MKDDVGNKYALAALRERRAELSGEIVQLESRLRHLRESLTHLDGALSVMSPDYDPKNGPTKRPYKRVKLFGQGKLNWLIFEVLRNAEKPMRTLEIVDAIVKNLNYGPDAANGMKGRVTLLSNSRLIASVKSRFDQPSRSNVPFDTLKFASL